MAKFQNANLVKELALYESIWSQFVLTISILVRAQVQRVLVQACQRHFYPRVKLINRPIIQSSKQAEQIMASTVKPTLTTGNKLLDQVFMWDLELTIQNLEYRAYLDKIHLADHEGRWIYFRGCWYRLLTTIHPLKRTLIGVLRL